MHDIQKDLVHTVDPSRCGNCRRKREDHCEGKCLFDATTFRPESAADHLDCVCETISEVGEVTTKPNGEVVVELTPRTKEALHYLASLGTR